MSGVDPAEVLPLHSAFDRVAALLPKLSTDVRLLVTQCLFPTVQDFALYPPISDALDARGAGTVKRVIKPGNSILHAAGSTQWFDELAGPATANVDSEPGVPTVVLGGCTLTSCIRVSALDLYRHYFDKNTSQPRLKICVDLNLCAARASNYIRRCHACMSQVSRCFNSMTFHLHS